MALFSQGAFQLDPNETPQSIAKKRALVQSLMMNYGSADNIGEGIGQLFNGIGVGMANRKADKAEKAGMASGATARQNLYSMLMGGNSAPLMPGKYPDAPAAPQSSISSPNEGVAAMLKGEPVQGTMANARAVDRASMAGYSGDVRQTTPNYAGGGLAGKIAETAAAIGANPEDLATVISYETGGTFDPTKRGPTTQYGQHRGLIQFGEPQAKQLGVDWNNPVDSQLGANGAVAKYFKGAGYKPGMGMLDLYSAVNAGRVGRYNASDANNGGAPGTVADKVNSQMSGHRAKAQKLMAALMGGETTQIASAPNAYSMEANTGNRMPLADQGMQANTGNKMPLPDQGIQVASLDPSGGMASYAPSQPQTMYVGKVNPNGTIGTATQAVNGMAQGGLAQAQQPSPAPQPQQVAQAAPQAPQQPAMGIQDAGTPFERMAPQQQGGMNLEMLLQQAQNPWLDDQSKAFVNGLIQQEMQKRDPAYQQQQQMQQLEMQKSQLELQQMQNPQPKWDVITGKDGSIFRVNPQTGQHETIYGPQPDPVKPTADIQEYEYAVDQAKKAGVPQGQIPSFDQWTIQQKKAGASQVNIDQKAEGQFDKTLAEKQAASFDAMATDGVNAKADLAVIGQLDTLLQGQGGTLTGLSGALAQYGIGGEGVGDLQAADALINKLIPTQRQAGSGSMSDRDVEMFKASLPSLWKTPQGNQIILQTMRGLAGYKQAQGDIAQRVMIGEISRQDAVKALRALPNPLADIGKKKQPVTINGYQIEQVED